MCFPSQNISNHYHQQKQSSFEVTNDFVQDLEMLKYKTWKLENYSFKDAGLSNTQEKEESHQQLRMFN